MPTLDQFKTALITPATASRTALYDALGKRSAYVVVSGEDATDLTPPPLTTHVIYNGLVFWYDAADTTTAHDGVTAIVTFDGKRFKSDAFNGRGLRRYAVKDKDLATPPGSPALGDAYIVAAGGTGAWAGKDKKIAVFTARSWIFIQPNSFWEALVLDETLIYHYSAAAVWTAGVPGVVLPAGGVRIGNLKYGLGLRVFNQTTTAPPGSPAEGDAYIPATGATGAWAGQAGKVAIWETAAWTILTPVDGWTVYDATLNHAIFYEGGTWTDPLQIPAGTWKLIEDRTIVSAVGSADFVNLGAYTHLRARLFTIKGSASAFLYSRTSTNNGTSFDSGADYFTGGGSNTNQFSLTIATSILSTGVGLSGDINYDDFGVAKACFMFSNVAFQSSATIITNTQTQGTRVQTTARNAISLFFSSGNIASGRILLEGLV